jgi:hypothetical protein
MGFIDENSTDRDDWTFVRMLVRFILMSVGGSLLLWLLGSQNQILSQDAKLWFKEYAPLIWMVWMVWSCAFAAYVYKPQ